MEPQDSPSVQHFASLAARFCGLVEAPLPTRGAAQLLLGEVSNLFAAALALPEAPEPAPDEVEVEATSDELMWRRVFDNVASRLDQHLYSMVFDPLQLPSPESSLVADLADDFQRVRHET